MGKTLKNILNFLRPYRITIVAALILSAAGSVLTVVTPNYISRLISIIEAGLTSPLDMEAVKAVACTSLLYLNAGHKKWENVALAYILPGISLCSCRSLSFSRFWVHCLPEPSSRKPA